jgi:hypothetical protein
MYTRLFPLLIIVVSVMILAPGGAHAAWPADGAPVCELPEIQKQPRIISDGAGGTITAWLDDRGSSGFALYAQRLDGSGNPYWTLNGVEVSDVYSPDMQMGDMVPDGNHGAIIVWFLAGESDVFVHKIDETGALPWGPGGTWFTVTGQPDVIVTAPDGTGGVLLAWQTLLSIDHDVFAQRIDANGNEMWMTEGVPVFGLPGNELDPCIIADGSGGVFVAAVCGDRMRCQRI